jgi:hypothetical protein
MRFIGLFAIVALLVLPAFTGCKEAKEDMEEYNNAVMTLPDRARVISDLTRIRSALELYKIDSEGRYPDSISELNLEKLYYPDEYEYDSSTGKVRSKEYPTL